MKTAFLIFFTVLLSSACDESSSSIEPSKSSEVESEQPTNNEEASYLALGDSYTIGQSVTVAERWPVILANQLRKLNKKVADPDIIATTGWTTRDLLSALGNAKITKTYNAVSLLIGVNNQYQGQSIDTFRAEFATLLSKSVGFTGGKREKVFVLSVPDWGASRYGAPYDRKQITKEIDQFNAVVKEECLKEKILFIDITDLSRRALDNPALLASDGLHYSGTMHQLWVDSTVQLVKGFF